MRIKRSCCLTALHLLPPRLIQRWVHAEVHLSLSTELTFLDEGRLGRRVQLSMAQEL